jgi:hypothetical protein
LSPLEKFRKSMIEKVRVLTVESLSFPKLNGLKPIAPSAGTSLRDTQADRYE